MSGVRFCPFCKEPFEGEICPDHGLPLISLVELASVKKIPGETDPLAPTDFRFGRLSVVLGAVVVMIGFFLPAVVDGTRDGQTTTAFQIWQLRADYLSVVPGAMFALPVLVFVRNSRLALVRARPALGLLAFTALGALVVAASHVVSYAWHLDRIGAERDLRPAIGVWIMALGFAVLARAISRLGRVPR